jgi:hypothetical protein
MVLKNSEVNAPLASTGSYALSNAASSSQWIHVESSTLFGGTYGILNGANVTTEVYFSQINSNFPASNSGNLFCFTTYDAGGGLLSVYNCERP